MPTDNETEEHWRCWQSFSLEAYTRFQTALERHRDRHPGLTSYDIVQKVNETKGTFAWFWGASSEVQESINLLNAWGIRIHEWSAWNDVVSNYQEEERKWEILNHFLEPIAFYCMLQPSSFADRLALTAENLIHQANQFVSPEEPDRLVQDDRPGKPLRRSDRRKQLGKLGERWKKFSDFQRNLHLLDGDEYSGLTSNFRDLAAHSFSPRLLLGQISRSIRSIVPFPEMARQDDGTYLEVEHPTKTAVSYAMICQEPLSLEETHDANLAEYQRAKLAMEALIALTYELCNAIDQKIKNSKVIPDFN
ncbi:hypothetical protein [Xanthomonas arboricola]|uniref:hypothetical protein n=1 Tax=Xanthomonas arboricola TaxID=56448 RepID=UPI00201967EF|nr:hypothetical protein [Xanthomonas arboricola]UQQ14982.1 hypothetical protein KPG65_00125 [Xanthomonas arboricola pv. corylina]